MTAELGLNLAGVERVLAARGRSSTSRTVSSPRLEARAERAKLEMAAELERVRRSLRADIVPYTGTTDIVRRVDVRAPFVSASVSAGGAPPGERRFC